MLMLQAVKALMTAAVAILLAVVQNEGSREALAKEGKGGRKRELRRQ